MLSGLLGPSCTWIVFLFTINLTLTACGPGLQTTTRSTVADDFAVPVEDLFVSVEAADLVAEDELARALEAAFAEYGAAAEWRVYDNLELDEAPGLDHAKENEMPYALLLTFNERRMDSDGIPESQVPMLINVDAGLYDVDTGRRMWRGIVETFEDESFLADRIANELVQAMENDGVFGLEERNRDALGAARQSR
ncbi:hypothetical protein CRI94_04055 [Longibacter salinarum]|uniref:Uncharacterized protein n=1 Tax=Longibacter salinarum TaxID=1850348 RepID=A0A2A8D037_9BACT|nr:hypothetical protein CRI94_04055 [Longibacter salinarum]